jgi:hypothetical protein
MAALKKTHCKRGHELTDENVVVYFRKDRNVTERACLPCRRVRWQAGGSQRSKWLKHKYGITQADYDALFEAQSGLCAVCRKPEVIKDAPLRVDHNHHTGKVRGLLCHHCNVALGHFKDDPQLLRAAMEYLDE